MAETRNILPGVVVLAACSAPRAGTAYISLRWGFCCFSNTCGWISQLEGKSLCPDRHPEHVLPGAATPVYHGICTTSEIDRGPVRRPLASLGSLVYFDVMEMFVEVIGTRPVAASGLVVNTCAWRGMPCWNVSKDDCRCQRLGTRCLCSTFLPEDQLMQLNNFHTVREGPWLCTRT